MCPITTAVHCIHRQDNKGGKHDIVTGTGAECIVFIFYHFFLSSVHIAGVMLLNQ